MNLLVVPRIQPSDPTDIGRVTASLEKLTTHPIDAVPWPKFSYKPEVRFCIAHNGSSIFLHFHVQETAVCAAVWETNGPVSEDSCVEFFIAFDEAGYYNLECNAIGTLHVAFGSNRSQRTFLDTSVITTIQRQSVINKTAAETEWKVAMVIPLSVFMYHNITTLSGKKATANFYKCGDDLPQPHYLAWKSIRAPEPDFHLPQYFGTLEFES